MTSPYSSSSSHHVLCLEVTQEEFKAFHNIDRRLYTRLVFDLNRDPVDSKQVMALWIWLERIGLCHNFVDKVLSFPDSTINALANEAALCLKCVESNSFHSSSDATLDLPWIHSLSQHGLSLRFFHENRSNVVRGLTKIMNEVCGGVFDDIMRQATENSEISKRNNRNRKAEAPAQEMSYSSVINPYYSAGYNQMKLTVKDGPSDSYSRDDSTVFLTFSKGYHITQDEVMDFFTRKNGDCIKAIYMQKVTGREQQPLFARLLLRSPTVIQTLLEGKKKAKFTINGKHVWARKYVGKSLPTSPPAAPKEAQVRLLSDHL